MGNFSFRTWNKRREFFRLILILIHFSKKSMFHNLLLKIFYYLPLLLEHFNDKNEVKARKIENLNKIFNKMEKMT